MSDKRIQSINIAPVKSLGLVHPQAVHIDSRGILEDRRFHLIDGDGRLLTQRQLGRLVQVRVDYQMEPERLALRFPDGTRIEGTPEMGEPVTTSIFGRFVAGRLVTGRWSEALSQFCGRPVTLVQSDEPGQCYDEYPLSIVSQASIEELGQQPAVTGAIDHRRFRPNFLVDGCLPHEEDSWIDGSLRIGDNLTLRIVARDPRCAITTHDPDTGEQDMDTLRLILSYRPDPQAAYFGMYGIVEHPGDVSLGDMVTPL